MATLLSLKDYKVYYRTLRGWVRAVDGVNLDVVDGEILGLIGESGSGKSTLVMSIALPKPPLVVMGGAAIFRGIDLVKLSARDRRELLLKEISLVPQYALDALPVIKKIKAFLRDLARDKGVDEEEVLERFVERARFMGLPREVVDMYPIELSGGMRQRVVIAIATLFSPRLLIADEPTSALDVSTQRQVLELLLELRDTRIVGSIVFVTHDIASVRQIADRIAVMYAGKVVEVGYIEDVIREPLHPYTAKLIEAVPRLGVNYKTKRLRGLPGSPPSLLNPPPGCRFHPRCPYALPVCAKKEPPRLVIGNRVVSCWKYVEGEGG